jgi:hypothetical protein
MTKWNRDSILRWILERDSKGLPVNAKAAREMNCYMYRLGITSFGSWACALSAAGIHVASSPRRWSSKRIVATIRRIGRRPEALRYASVYRRRRSLCEAARKCFGSWRQALLAADIAPQSVQGNQRWDRESIIEAILERALRHQPLARTKVQPSGLRAAAVTIYGSWPNALAAAGLKPDVYLREETTAQVVPHIREKKTCGHRRSGRCNIWTQDIIAQALRERVKDQKPIHISKLRREASNLYRAIKRHFGNWASAMKFAGLAPEEFRKDRRQPVKAGAMLCTDGGKDGDGERVSADNHEAIRTDKPPVVKVPNCKADGTHRPHRLTKWTREAIIAAIQARAACGLTLKKWRVQPYHLGRVASIKFGSWEEALRAAGVAPNQQQPDNDQGVNASAPQPIRCDGVESVRAKAGPPWTRQAILEVIRGRADAHLPLNEAIVRVDCGGMYGAAKSNFGSWAGALVAFGLNPDDVRKGPGRANRIPHSLSDSLRRPPADRLPA